MSDKSLLAPVLLTLFICVALGIFLRLDRYFFRQGRKKK
jgi:hypothetical protein